MAPWISRIRRALRPSGGRSALTALDTASIPVSEDPPLANARASVRMAAKAIRVPVPCPIGTVPAFQVACGRPPPTNSRASPTMIIRPTDAGEQVGRQREHPAVLPDAEQVHVAHQERGRDRDQQQGRGVSQRPGQRREGGQDRGAAGRVLHRDRDHVVHHQRHGRDLGDPRAEVLPGHHVGAARPGVDRHHLAVGQHDQEDAEQDHPGQRHQQRERGQAEERQQFVQDQLGAVVRRRDPVAGQHAQGERLGQPLLFELLGDQRRAEHAALDGVPEGLRELVRLAAAEQAGRPAHGH